MNALSDTLQKMEALAIKLEQWAPAEELLDQLDDFPLSVQVVNQEGKIEAVNQAFVGLSGFGQQELIGKPFNELSPEESKEHYENLHKHFLQSPFKFSGQFSIINKAGEEINLLAAMALLRIKGEDKRFTLLLEAADYAEKNKEEVRKLAELTTFSRKLEEKLQTHYPSLDPEQVADGAEGHDVNNQLHHIKSIAEIMYRQQYSEEEQKNMLSMIIEATDRALAQISKKSTIDLLESGHYKLNKGETDLLKSFEKANKRLDPLFESKHLKLLIESDNPKHLDGSNQAYLLHADSFFIDMMIFHLLENAAEASPEHETILVHVTTASLTVELSIHNWGTVDPDIKEHFFDKYVTRGKKMGAGLGTYVSKLIAKAHNGMITMRTDKERGTYVVVGLPIMHQPQSEDAA